MTRYPAIDLTGTLVAVTGAARGIGLATARAFADAGAHVALGDLDADLASTASADLGHRAMARYLDVTDTDSFQSFLGAAEAWADRPLDILVNNAGVMPNGPFLDQDNTIDRLTIDVNVFGIIHGMRLAAPPMVARGRGHIVNIASMAGLFPIPGLAVYNASKYAAVGLTAATRLELNGTGVSVSAVLPSAVRTELTTGINYGRLPASDPEDIAAAVLKTVRTRAAQTCIPSYLGVVAHLTAITPEPLMRIARRMMRDDAALTRVDPTTRQAYLDRIAHQ
jgi:short-subunit dehydrogenase